MFEWRGTSGAVEVIEFRIGHGDMVRLLRASGFEIEVLIEIQPPTKEQTRKPSLTSRWN